MNGLFPENPLGDERFARLALHLVDGVGPRLGKGLIEALGSARAVFAASKAELLGIEGVGPTLVQRLIQARLGTDLAREWALLQKHEADFHTIIDPDYPQSLCPFEDSPMILYEKGMRTPVDKDSVAIVGSRGATSYGLRMTKKISQGLAECGFTIISGLARGLMPVPIRRLWMRGGGPLRCWGMDCHGFILRNTIPWRRRFVIMGPFWPRLIWVVPRRQVFFPPETGSFRG